MALYGDGAAAAQVGVDLGGGAWVLSLASGGIEG